MLTTSRATARCIQCLMLLLVSSIYVKEYGTLYSYTGVKTFLERFGERYQDRTNQSSPAGGIAHGKAPNVTPSAVTPNTRLAQERFRAAQAANTTTADLTQRQKLVEIGRAHV